MTSREIASQEIESIYPLSPSQRGIYFEALGLRDPALHIEQAAITLRGELDAERLARAWQRVADRQPMLRTGFAGRELDRPMQVVYQTVQAATALHDLTAEADPAGAIERLLADDRAAGFVLARPPLIRLSLFRLGPQQYRLAWTHHHILMDGWCISLLMRDLFEAYRDPPAPFASAPSYRDYIRWIRQQDPEQATAFWRTRLRGFARPTALGRPSGEAADAGGDIHGHCVLRLDGDRAAELAAVARRQRITQGAVVQAAWAVLLGHYAGDHDVLFGVTVAGRPPELDGIEEMVGMFATALPLRVVLDPAEPAAALLERLHRLKQEQQPYEAFGGGQIHDCSALPGSWPLFESLVTFENYPIDPAALGNGEIVVEPATGRSFGARTRHALVLLVTPGRELELELVFDRRRFDDADVPRILRDMASLLGAIVAEPAVSVGALWAGLPADGIPRVRLAPWQIAGPTPAAAAPRTTLEALVERTFAAVLGVSGIGMECNFFDLGGHSLLATRAISRLSEAVGHMLPLRLLFDNPTAAGLAAELERQAAVPSSAPAGPAIVPADRSRPIPLTQGQERLWFLDRLGEARSAYCEQGAVRLGGPLDAVVLERCLGELVRRHESLRTTFAEADGAPVQRIAEIAALPFRAVDLAGRDSHWQEVEIRRAAADIAEQPFDLTQGPLVRFTLFGLGPDDHVLLLSIHHIITDGWSHSILFRELAVLYEAFSAGQESPLKPLAIQFADFAAWQRQKLDSPAAVTALLHRAERLRGAPPRSGLPADGTRPAGVAGAAASVSRTLSRGQRDALMRVGSESGCTLFMTLLAAFAALLRRHSGQDDLTFGVPAAGRDVAALEDVFGFFVNTLAVRTDLSGNPSFRDLLARVREETLDAFAHPDVPFDRLVEAVRPERIAGVNPLFQVFVNMLSHPPVDVRLGGLHVEQFPLPRGSSMFDITLYLTDSAGRLQIDLVYDPALFADDRMSDLLGQFECLLAAVAADPDVRIDACALTDGPPRLPDPLPRDGGTNSTALSLFEARALQVPNRTALIGRDGPVSFTALDAASSGLAARLRDGGVEPGDVVAIYGHRSAALVQAMLGIHKAGAAFTILDPAYPADRLLACLNQSRPAGWIAIEAAGAPPPALIRSAAELRCQVTLPPIGPAAPAGGGSAAPAMAPGPDDDAYVAFTSGTTGAPRGIRGTHRPIAHFLYWYARRFAIGQDDRFAVLSGLSHDPLLRDVFAPLAAGATLCIPDPADMESPERLVRWLAANAVSVMHLTPALAQAICAAGTGAALPALRLAGIGGAPLGGTTVRRLRELAPGAACVNFYGATETPQVAAFHPIAEDPAGDGSVLPIGQGIDGVQLLVLDAAGRRAAPFEAGEICVRSRYLARAIDSSAAEGFAPDPFGDDPEIRLYRTGDLGRVRLDDVTEFVGRRDRQVKIRGYRVELAEIEQHLLSHPAVRQAAVTVHGDDAPAGYWVGEKVAPDELRAFLTARLPAFMVPGSFVRLEQIPRTPNGKLDISALPRPADMAPAPGQGPRDEVERRLSDVFAAVLGRDAVGIHDDFFGCGGHSLKAMQLVSRVHRDLGTEIPLRVVFEGRTVAALAAAVRAGTPGGFTPIPVTELAAHGPLSHAERRLWLLDRLEEGAATAYALNDALLLEGSVEPERIEAAFQAVVRRHESLRTVFRSIGGVPRRVVLPDIDFRCPVIDLSGEPNPRQRAREYADEDARTAFPLADGPLLRITLLRLGPAENVLLFCIHHIISDWWSIGVLVRDFLRAYRGGEPAILPPLRIQYRDYAAWQAERLACGALDADREYWLARLADGPPPLDLPADFARPAVRTHRGAVQQIRLHGAGRELSALGERHGRGLFTVLVALVKVLFHRLTGQEDIVIGAPVAGRDHIDLEDQIGCFVNMLVLRDRIAGDWPFAEVIDAVRRTVTDAFAHQAYPFDLLVEDLKVRRDPGRSPLFDVALVLQQGDKPELALPDLNVAPFGQTRDTAKYDLRLVFEQNGDDLVLDLEYDSSLFAGDRIARLSEQLRVLAAAAVRDPSCRVDALELLPAAERRLVLETFAATAAIPEDRSCLHALFAEQAARTPDAVAVAFGDRTVTYAELDQRANRLAHRLRGPGVGPEVLVGLCMERSPELIIGILAILKAGGAYLPLDPADPGSRLALMLADANCSIVLCQKATAARLPAGPTLVVVPHSDEAGAEPSDAPADAANPDNAAYVIYTSGSTGRPKGVVVPHRNVVRLFCAAQAAFQFGSADIWTLFHSCAFDFSVWEIWGALLYGGRLVVVPHEVTRAPGLFHRLLREQGVTVLNQTPSAFRQLMRYDADAEPAAALRLVIFGGEALNPASLQPWFGRHGETPALVNMYGITETTVHVTLRPLTARDAALAGSPIGRPLTDLFARVLDANRQPVPVGVAGELYVGGPGVARGYLNRPGLTAERFVPDPFGTTPGTRLYRTGDQCRWTAEGTLEFFGRIDGQVKIRGFRIEPGEIEAALAAHPAVRECTVIARASPGGDRNLVAYVAGSADPGLLRQHVRQRLPEHMVPAHIVCLPALPLTNNGKIDRAALPAPETARPAAAEAPRDAVEEAVAEIWCDVLETGSVGIRENFFDAGGHSLRLIQVHERLEARFGRHVTPVELFQFPTIEAIAALVSRRIEPATAGPAAGPVATADHASACSGIAIIGMSGRFPGAPDIGTLWENLCGGVDSVRFFTDEELHDAGVPADVYSRPGYVKAKPILDDVESFDAAFFAMTPREAEITDPQHRLFLETAWNTLEDAGYAPSYSGRIGVFAGCGTNSYLYRNLLPNLDRLAAMGDYPLLIGNDDDYLATRVAYKLNLRGPAITVGTACSTSLVAVDLACQSLMTGRADMALAGGVSVKVPQVEGYQSQPGGVLSPEGRCRAFDAGGDGIIGGNGVAAVLLKPLSRALADGDHIYAVIRASATNNDGSAKVGFTAPGVDGQASVIRACLDAAGIDPASIGYVETHGAGTPLGDPIEVAALSQAFGVTGSCPAGSIAIGSVKSNLGHLDAAAGVAGLIKAALAVFHGRIPPSLHFRTPNPHIGFDNSPFRVNTALTEWPAASGPRRAAVSSFGLGGTNAHAILEQASPRQAVVAAPVPRLLVLSAKTPAALAARAADLAGYLRQRPGMTPSDLAEVAFTLQVGRAALEYRRTLVCADAADAMRQLDDADAGQAHDSRAAASPPRVAFLFPGQGTLRAGIGGALYRRDPVFRGLIDECCERLRPYTAVDPRTILCPSPDRIEQAEQLLDRTSVAQPALFVLEYALARLLQARGIEPACMLGHSLGEYVAACLAGVFEPEDALALMVERGRLTDTLPGGEMLAVALNEVELATELDPALDVAAINGPDQCVVAGPQDVVEALHARLSARTVMTQRLRIAHAFHSRSTDRVLETFTARVAAARPRPPRVPYLSNVSGTWITAEEASDPAYYARHLRGTVRFHDGLSALLQDPGLLLVEVGPGARLARLARRHSAAGGRLILCALTADDGAAEDVQLLRTLGRLWEAGVPVDPRQPGGDLRPNRVAVPGYRFERVRHWVEAPREMPAGAAVPVPQQRPAVEDWFHVPDWRSVPAAPAPELTARGRWLAVNDGLGLGAALARLLTDRGNEVRAVPGDATPDDYAGLLGWAGEDDRPLGIIDTGPLLGPDANPAEATARGYGSLLSLARALDIRACSAARLAVIADHLLDVAGESAVMPEKAMLLGPLKVLPQENVGLVCRAIDVIAPETSSGLDVLARQVLPEILAGEGEPLVALRGHRRWIPGYRRVRPAEFQAATGIRAGGVYMVTGGLGGVGLVVAKILADAGARLVLISRSGLAGRPPQTLEALSAIKAEAAGTEIVVADVTDAEAMAEAVRRTRRQFGPINGVVHAAGETREGTVSIPIGEIGPLETKVALHARVQGMRVLEQVLADEPIDFALAISSNAAVLGGLGFAAYAAACSCMDALAGRSGARLPWVSANWDRWPTIRAAGTYTETRSSIDRFAFDAKEAAETLGWLTGRAWRGQVVVSAGDLSSRLARWVGQAPARESRPSPLSAADDFAPAPVPARRDSTPGGVPADSIEAGLIALWRDLIGAKEIGLRDNFFEIGGDSLIGIQLIAHVGRAFGVRLPVDSLFEYPTITGLADCVRRLREELPRSAGPPALMLSHGLEEGEI